MTQNGSEMRVENVGEIIEKTFRNILEGVKKLFPT